MAIDRSLKGDSALSERANGSQIRPKLNKIYRILNGIVKNSLGKLTTRFPVNHTPLKAGINNLVLKCLRTMF